MTKTVNRGEVLKDRWSVASHCLGVIYVVDGNASGGLACNSARYCQPVSCE